QGIAHRLRPSLLASKKGAIAKMYSSSLARVMAAALTLTFAGSTAIAQPNDTHKDKPKVRTDAQGGPLPPRAIARLGTLRLRDFRGPVWRVEYSADGRHVMTRDSYRLVVWEAATGRLLRR